MDRSILPVLNADREGENTEDEESDADHCYRTRTHRTHHCPADDDGEQDDEGDRGFRSGEFHG